MEFQHFRVARNSAATAPRAAVNFVWGACVRGLSSSFRAANSRTTFLPIYLRPQTPDCGEIVLKSSRYARLALYRQQQQKKNDARTYATEQSEMCQSTKKKQTSRRAHEPTQQPEIAKPHKWLVPDEISKKGRHTIKSIDCASQDGRRRTGKWLRQAPQLAAVTR